ncbi:MAG: cell division protein ZapB [Treponema sp.]|nr:cell division protein ZapB [Treponema sp.]
MISLDQVELLEAKIESAVAKITQLQVENDALRNRVQELSNALSAKSEQLSLCEKDQAIIETGILKALNRLNSIENTVLKSAGSSTPVAAVSQPAAEAVVPSSAPVVEEVSETVAEEALESEVQETIAEDPFNFQSESEVTESEVPEESPVMEEEIIDEEIDIPVMPSEPVPSQEPVTNPFDINKSDVPGFDIF